MKYEIIGMETQDKWTAYLMQDIGVGTIGIAKSEKKAHEFYDDEELNVEDCILKHGYKFKHVGEHVKRPEPPKSKKRGKKR